jgi:hypothetical protein
VEAEAERLRRPGTRVAPALRMRSRLLALVALAGFACTTPCRSADSEAARRELARDDERCQDQAQKLAGNVDLGDYLACMRVRGWCRAPEDAPPDR